jgi:hypothetical protein
MAFVLSGISILHCLLFWIAKGGAEDGRYFRPQKTLEGFETTRRATIGNQHPRASQTRAPSAAARPGGVGL